MMNKDLLKQVINKIGGNADDLPDNLLTTHLKALCEALGIDTSDVQDNLMTTYLGSMHASELPDNLLTTHLEALCSKLGIDTSDMEDRLASSYFKRIVGGEISGGGSNVNYADQLYEFYGIDKAIYPYLYAWYEDANPTYKVYVYFAKTVDAGYCENVMLAQNYKMTKPFDLSSIDTFIANLEATLPASGLTSASAKWAGRETSASYYYYFNQATYDVMASQLSGANIFNLGE